MQATLDMADVLIPGFIAFHPMGARLAQECVRMTAGDFRSMIFPTQYRVPTYNHWLLARGRPGSGLPLAPAVPPAPAVPRSRSSSGCSSRRPTSGTWTRWLAEYPDAVLVQTHRDPLKVIASVSALVAHLRRMASDDTSVAEAAAEYAEDILLGLDRGMDARDRGTSRPTRSSTCSSRSSWPTRSPPIAGDLRRLGRELDREAEAGMRAFLASNPGDGGGGGTATAGPTPAWTRTSCERGPPPTRSGTGWRRNR